MIGIEPLRRVAFVDDDALLRAANAQTLSLAGLEPETLADAQAALSTVGRDYPGVVVSDVRMPGMDGLQLFRRLRDIDPDLPVILITGHGDVPMAVAALKDGAWDFVTKPFAGEQLVASIRRGLEARRLVLENRALRAAAEQADAGEPLIGQTPAMIDLRETMRELAMTQADVLIEGETGAGKEMVAVLLHRWSARRAQPFVAVNCGALPADLAGSELFGHRDGVVPGARLSRTGRIEAAHHGTLFLDELDSMPEPIQVAMLRVLEEREVMPLGSDEPRDVDLRVIAAVKEDPIRLVGQGRLREDLLYRLNVVRLRVPPLRERRDDIPLLYAHFLTRFTEREGLALPPMSDAVRHHLHAHDWPGNVRELRHFAHRMALDLRPGAAVLDEDALPGSLPERTQRFETEEIGRTLAEVGGDVRTAIEALGLPRKTFYDKVTRYGIDLNAYRARPRGLKVSE